MQRMQHVEQLALKQCGTTGLETATITIEFLVVASIFAYTVLSAGIFSSEKGKGVVYAGLEQVQSTIEIVGPVVAKDTDDDDDIDEIVFIVANALDGEPINMTTTTYGDGKDDSDDLLEANEKFEVTVTAAHLATKLDKDDTFTIEIKPDGTASLVIGRTLPSVIDEVYTLNQGGHVPSRSALQPAWA